MRWALPAGIAVAALAIGYFVGRDGDDPPGAQVSQAPFAGAATGTGAGSLPPLTGSMRDQADRLFERIMQARARGDTAEASFFMPMALQAYDGAEPLDADGMFHVGLLQLGAGNTDEATAAARRISEGDPNHLFGLALRGEAALAAGDQAAARSAFAEYMARFDSELARALPEYEMHRPALDEYRERGRSLAGS
jgi:tetratricopeptide (TPR) repeat protein